jgi:hypothetical protein
MAYLVGSVQYGCCHNFKTKCWLAKYDYTEGNQANDHRGGGASNTVEEGKKRVSET